MNDDMAGVGFPEWISIALTAPAELDSYGTELTGNSRLICDGLKKLVRLVAEWSATNNTTDVPWHCDTHYGRDPTGGSMMVALRMTHDAESHDFCMHADFVANTTHAYKTESVNHLSLETTPRAVGAA